jgi:hypothetical protein
LQKRSFTPVKQIENEFVKRFDKNRFSVIRPTSKKELERIKERQRPYNFVNRKIRIYQMEKMDLSPYKNT